MEHEQENTVLANTDLAATASTATVIPSEDPGLLSSVNEQPTRRKFIRDVGGLLFAVTVVDIADAAFLTGQVYAQSGGCGLGVVDSSCSATTPDSNCGFNVPAGGGMDPDEGCRASPQDADQACGQIAKDVDQACSATDQDQNCNKPHSTPGLTDADNSCTTTSLDESCGNGGGANNDESCNATSMDESCHDSAAKSSHNEDQSCTGTGADLDEACGTNSATGPRDEDQHCGQPASGTTDADQACGMTYTWFGITYTDPDNAA